MIVVGGGIGGMLMAALCRKVTLFERAPVLGGRFRNLPMKGFSLSTGALHMIPHAQGVLPKLLADMEAGCTIVKSDPAGTFLLEREYGMSEVFSLLGIRAGVSLSRLLLEMKVREAPPVSIEEYVKGKMGGANVSALLASFCGWSLSMHPRDVPAHEFFLIVRHTMECGGPGIPMGGCSALIDALHRKCAGNGNAVVHKKVTRIVVEDDRVAGVLDEDGVFHEDDTVVSDIGARETGKLCAFPGEYQEKIDALVPSAGIKISVASKESLIPHTGVLFTPTCQRICGANQVTNADPTLAPKGWHLVMTHQPLLSGNVKKERELGLADLDTLFGEKKYEVLAVQPFSGDHPVNRARSGHDLPQKTPIDGLFLVGDCAKAPGGMEVEGIAGGVARLIKDHLSSHRAT